MIAECQKKKKIAYLAEVPGSSEAEKLAMQTQLLHPGFLPALQPLIWPSLQPTARQQYPGWRVSCLRRVVSERVVISFVYADGPSVLRHSDEHSESSWRVFDIQRVPKWNNISR